MTGKYIWVEDRQRKAKGKRRSTRGIKTTRRADPFVRKVRTGWKGFIRTVKLVLMAAGTVALLIVVLNWLGGG